MKGGLAATVLGDASLWELKETRLILEGHIAYLAAMRADEAGIEMLRDSLQRDRLEALRFGSGFQFHKILATLTENSLLAGILNSVQARLEEVRSQYSKVPVSVFREFDQEHTIIFELVKERKPDEAREAMLQHIEAAWFNSLYAELREKPDQKK